MGCLWLTLADPDPPGNGQFIYSGGLIRAGAAAGLDLTVLGVCQTGGRAWRCQEGRIAWHITDDLRHSRMTKLFSPVPAMALRSRVPAMVQAVSAYLDTGPWDAVIFDSICVGWALPAALRHRRRFPSTKIVLLAHNDETAAARHLAASSHRARRFVRSIDAAKVARLERSLLAEADLLTANSPDDCNSLGAVARRPVHFLPPGYGGKTVASRTIDESVPRRAVVVGTFDWPVKRASLESFLNVAAPMFTRAGVELQIVGTAEPSYLDGLRRRHPGIEFTGRVADVVPHMASARIALVPDQAGGFKLKSLDYIFNRLPMFAMAGAVPGIPLADGNGIRLFSTHEAMARDVLAAIDDLPALNAQQQAAFNACAPCFDWQNIGRSLAEMIGRAKSRASPLVSVRGNAPARRPAEPSVIASSSS